MTDIEVRPDGSGGFRVAPRGEADGQVVSAADLALLRSCSRFRTVREHATAFAQRRETKAGSRKRLRRRLEEMVAAGLLDRVPVLEPGPPEPPPQIETLAFVTANRPALMERAVRSALETMSVVGRRLPIAVYDDTEDPKVARENRARLEAIHTETGAAIRYAGPSEKAAFIEALVGHGIPRDLATFALRGVPEVSFRAGANRNAVLLDNLDAVFVGLDDDTICRFAQPPGASEEVELGSRQEPTEFWFYDDPEAAVADADPQPMDFVAAHERLLGRGVADVFEGAAVEWDGVGAEVVRALSHRTSRVRLSLLGALGDSGMGGAHYYLHLKGPSHERAASDEVTWQRTRLTRAVLRAPLRPVVTRSPLTLMMGAGLDQRGVLPPFFPCGRNSDGLFTQFLLAVHRDALVAHLPLAVAHLPVPARRHPPEEVWRQAVRMGLSEVVRWALEATRLRAEASAEERLTVLGRSFRELGRLEHGAFASFLLECWARRCSGVTLALERQLEARPDAPPRWIADARQALDVVREAGSSGPPVARSLAEYSPVQARERAQALLAAYGELLGMWSEVCAATQKSAEEGQRPAAPLSTSRT
jgi:hypothetical protein